MIVLDTNVLSELGRKNADENVLAWAESVEGAMVTTAVTAGEMARGVMLLPPGTRRTSLWRVVLQQLSEFDRRGGILPFDNRSAWAFGEVTAVRRTLGRPISDADAMIAAICIANQAPLATRNVRDFEETGVEVVSPWS